MLLRPLTAVRGRFLPEKVLPIYIIYNVYLSHRWGILLVCMEVRRMKIPYHPRGPELPERATGAGLERVLAGAEDFLSLTVDLVDGGEAKLYWINGMAKTERLNDYIIRPLSILHLGKHPAKTIQAGGVWTMVSPPPKDLEEAALIDGMSYPGIFLKVILPLSKPILLSQGMFAFLGAWNSYLWPLIATMDEKLWVISVGIASFRDSRNVDWNAILTGATASMIPTAIMFAIFQKQLVEGIKTSGMKM